MRQKKVPMRMCVGCREMKPKRELLRVVKSPEGDVSVDMAGKKSGRGVYICPDAQCLQKAQRSRQLERALETAIGDDVFEALRAAISDHAQP